ncbi:hypothetical protein ABOZ73_00295 [Caulobacter sp. 73W]|uniref:PepSY domain-containing protein n=1 Tax=Caulobacter sp. 73W TaxID=3161137 RepID=A0AB39KUJ8_9CAUL
MRLPWLARSLHKWLALVVGVQLAIWTLSGLYMVVVHIDIIHGDHLVRSLPPARFDLRALSAPAELMDPSSDQGARLISLRGAPAYVIDGASGRRVVDARSGAPLPPLNEAEIRPIAQRLYTGDGAIETAELLTKAPGEIKGRAMPIWRVEFEGLGDPTFYLSPQTGELVSRRHDLWRAFDIAWMLHIMDYKERADVNNPLLRVVTVAAAFTTLSGAWLLLYSFPKRKRRRARSTT